MIGRTIKPRVFLEGVEIPVYRITIQTSIGAPSAAVLDIPPSEEFFERFEKDEKTGEFTQKTGVLPRTLVHIFYEDNEDPDGVARLLFEGEFVKFEYSKTVEGRSIKLVARDISNLLTTAYVRYYGDFFTPYANLITAFTGQGTVSKPNPEQIRLAIINASTGLNADVMAAIQNDTAGVGVAAAFRDIARKAGSFNTFFNEFELRTKISEKIVALPDTKSKLLLEATQLASLIKQNMANLKEFSTVWDLYTMLMSLVFYFPVPIPSAPFLPKAITQQGSTGASFEVSKGATLMSLLIKPYTWWTAPPTFNVIFPSQYKTFSFGRDFMAEPTRLIMSAFGVLESLAQTELQQFAPSQFMFMAPSALAKKFEQEASDTKTGGEIKKLETDLATLIHQRDQASASLFDASLSQQQQIALQQQVTALNAQVTQKEAELASARKRADAGAVTPLETSGKKPVQVSAGLWNRSILTAADGVASASREDIKGIVFAFDYLGQTQVEVSKAKGVDPNALKTYLSNVANYKLALQQHKDRMAQITMEFSPQLVCGFPALVVDPHRNFFGELDSVTHILDANGLADTQVQMSFVRTDEVEFSELDRNVPGKTVFPRWINERYLPGQIGDQVYKVLFPENRPDKSKPGIKAADSILAYDTSSTKTQIEAARVIRKLYYAAKDRERFALGFTRRNIASIDQALGILGAKRQGNTFVFSALSGVRFTAALEYSAAAFKVATSVVSDTTEEGSRPRTSVSSGALVTTAVVTPKTSSARVADATADGAKELEVRSASKKLKLEIVTRFTPPATVPPSGTVRFARSPDGKMLTSTYEDSENVLVDIITITEESGAEIRYSASGEYSAKLPNSLTGLLATASVTSAFGVADGQVTRDNAFLSGLQKVDPAVLAKLKTTR